MTIATSLDEAAAAFRASLLDRDAAALRRLMAAYQPVYERIQARVSVLTSQIAEAREAGETIRPSWLRERQRLARLKEQVIAEWSAYSDSAEGIITELQREAIAASLDESQQLTLAALDDVDPILSAGADVARLRPDAVEDLVGILSDGSPLRELLDDLGIQAAQSVEDTLLHAVATGRSPRRTARDLRDALGGDMTRALRITRTEHLRAYRTTALRSYQANDDILRGWQWRASPQRRTCPVCLAMDGQEFGLDVPFASHPNCRCTPIPLLRRRDAPQRETGAEWLARQSADVQDEILGPQAGALYRDGKLALTDLVGERTDPRWGPQRYRKSLTEIHGNR